MPLFEYAFNFAHGSYTYGEICADNEDQAKIKIEKSCEDDEPDYQFGSWILIRKKAKNPPLPAAINQVLYAA